MLKFLDVLAVLALFIIGILILMKGFSGTVGLIK